MSDHFSYLYEDGNAEFFQKEACAAADASMPRASEIVKTAAPISHEAYSMEKVASRLDRDLFIVKTAGESGFNLGAIRRSTSYFENLLTRVDMEPEMAIDVFDKIASEAITHDLQTVSDELYKLASEEHHAWIDAQIATAGIELVKAAEIDKEALIGLARTFRAAQKGLKATKGLGAGARVKAVTSSPGQAFRSRRVEVAQAKRSKAMSKLDDAKSKLKSIQAGAINAQKQVDKMPNGLKASIGPGVAKRQGKAVEKQMAKVEKRQGKFEGAKQNLKTRKAIQQGKPTQPQTPPTDDIAKAKQKQSTDAGKVQDKLKEVTKGGKGKKQAIGESAAAGEGATLKSSYSKMRDQGWGSLSGPEKQKLINAGLAGVVGHRVVMGKGAVTGGDGLV